MRFDDTAMKHGSMSNAYVVLENQRVFAFHDVTDGSVLDVCVFTDANVVYIAANDAVEPHARMIANLYIADDLGALSDEDAFSQLRPLSLVFMQHPGPPGKRTTLAERGQIIQGRYRSGDRFTHL